MSNEACGVGQYFNHDRHEKYQLWRHPKASCGGLFQEGEASAEPLGPKGVRLQTNRGDRTV